MLLLLIPTAVAVGSQLISVEQHACIRCMHMCALAEYVVSYDAREPSMKHCFWMDLLHCDCVTNWFLVCPTESERERKAGLQSLLHLAISTTRLCLYDWFSTSTVLPRRFAVTWTKQKPPRVHTKSRRRGNDPC